MKLALGMMSGTSADGVSLALCSFDKRQTVIWKYKNYDYPSSLRNEILRGSELKAGEISKLNIQLGHFYADCAVKFLKSKSPYRVSVIGSHGQTLFHHNGKPPFHSLQIGEPSIIAEKTGIPVVADFRMRDVAVGGQGAPLMPFFDQHFFGGGKIRALQNIGGIGNVAIVGKNSSNVAFDTGPGNCLIDLAIQIKTKGKKLFDSSGKIARKGKINERALSQMTRHSYFQKKPPKSTGRELFNRNFIPNFLWSENLENILATLTFFTAQTIYKGYKNFVADKVSEIIVSGGGALNLTLMEHLEKLFAPVPILSIEDLGIPAQAKEPIAFAFFAKQAIERKINHWPQSTGARHACVLGKIIY